MLTGMSVAYFDLLTFPVIALGFPLVTYILLSHGKPWHRFISNSFAWGIGYFGFWATKWVLAALIVKYPLASVLGDISFRLNSIGRGTDLQQQYDFQRLDGLQPNLQELFGSNAVRFILLLIAAAVAALLLVRVLRLNLRREYMVSALQILAVSLYPLVWYLVVLNHSAIHVFFTYRNLAVTVFGALCALVILLERRKRASITTGKQTTTPSTADSADIKPAPPTELVTNMEGA